MPLGRAQSVALCGTRERRLHLVDHHFTRAGALHKRLEVFGMGQKLAVDRQIEMSSFVVFRVQHGVEDSRPR